MAAIEYPRRRFFKQACGLACAAMVAPVVGLRRADASITQSAENLLLVTLDGLRWQELFSGADRGLMHKEFGRVRDLEGLERRFWRDTAEARRAALMPFFWEIIARQGQVFGDPELGSPATVANSHRFSYPGYHELLCGFADERINSNAKQNNPNATVLEWLNNLPAWRGQVAAFCSWDVFPYILNAQRSGLPVDAGWPDSHGRESLSADSPARLADELPRVWPEVRYDAFTYQAAEAYLRDRQPRVLYLALGETDDWAHEGRYDLYLDAARRSDRALARLWKLLQSLPHYAGKTALLISTDHGRGDTRTDWKNHGKDVHGAERIWMAAMGPGVAPAGVRRDCPVVQGQFAATAAALLGEDFGAAEPRAASRLPLELERVPDRSPASPTVRIPND